MGDEYMLERQVRSLENENRLLRETLRDKLAMAALTGLLASHGATVPARTTLEVAYQYADVGLEVRK
jgi:hypothetical protein